MTGMPKACGGTGILCVPLLCEQWHTAPPIDRAGEGIDQAAGRFVLVDHAV